MCVILGIFLIVVLVGAFVSYTQTAFLSTKPVSVCNSNINNGVCPSVMYSDNGLYQLRLQSDGNLIEAQVAGNSLIWASETSGKGTPPYNLTMQSDGNLVLYDSKNSPLWNSKTSKIGTGPFNLTLQNDKNIVITDSTGKPTWSVQTGIFK